MKFIREYCETNGKIHIQYLYRYINEKVVENLETRLNLNNNEIVAIGLQSFGKDIDFWKKIQTLGIKAIFENFDNDILKFLNEPNTFLKSLDIHSKEIFIDLIYSIINTDKLNKPAETIAKEISKAIFDNLVFNQNNTELEKIYLKWIDSNTYRDCFLKYAGNYKFPDIYNIWNVSIHHPFQLIDNEWLKEISKNIENKDFINSKQSLLKKRSENNVANNLGMKFWEHILTLLTYDTRSTNKMKNLNDVIEFYKNKFHKIDTAMRHLYNHFLIEKEILKPIQEQYQVILNSFLLKWFEYFGNYKENQTGLLKNIINNEPNYTVIIVGDGLSYEISQEIIKLLPNNYTINNQHTLADFPSETENNMSRLYMSNGKIEQTQSKREQFLRDETNKSIEFIDLDNIQLNIQKYDYLICKVDDIDSLGEKFQHQGLKFFDKIEKEIAEKIKILLEIGYKKVFITTDHGFVLTGILTESDKINFNFDNSECEKKERYILSNRNISNLPDYIMKFERKVKSYDYIYLSKSIAPFVSRGAYGFSHGGISPQELIIPRICIEKDRTENMALKVSILNKDELKEVPGELYLVKIKGDTEGINMFSSERKIQIICFNGTNKFYESDIKTINANETLKFENKFEVNEFELLVIDYNTKETLDKAKIKKRMIRDLGGL